VTRAATWILSLDLAAVAFVLATFVVLIKRGVQRAGKR
jgi:hypothetical protein